MMVPPVVCDEIVDKREQLKIKHLQHDTRIESCRIVCHKVQNYDTSYRVGRIANSLFDTKRLSFIVAYLPIFNVFKSCCFEV